MPTAAATSSVVVLASPPTTSGASSLSPFKIRYPGPRGIPVSAGAAYEGQGQASDHVSASANVASAAELRARMGQRAGEKKKGRKRTALAIDSTPSSSSGTSSTLEEQPFNMDGDTDEPSDESSDMMSPTSPHEKRLPFFANLERDQPQEIASSWSYMPQDKNAGMPSVRPQQPGLQEAGGSKVAPLSFGTNSSMVGSYGDSTPRRKSKNRHRVKDEPSSLTVTDAGTVRSPLSALTFGTKSPTSSVTDGVESMSLSDSQGSKPQIEVRVKTTPDKKE